ncbi:MAG TPA: hypothetical protein VM925_17125 [Labilithrix sp.]|nr:hypothetical protein [Labilithrix sp.]
MPAAVAASILAVPELAFAQNVVVDQTSSFGDEGNGASFNADSSSLTWQQQIKVGLGGKLAGITISANGNVNAAVNVRVRKGPAFSAQPVVFQSVVTKQSSGTETIFVDTAASNIDLVAGDLIVMEIQGNNTGLGLRGTFKTPPAYSEPLFLNGSNYGNWRLGFKTHMSSCPVGDACNDGDACTTGDTCQQNGTCAGTPVVCTAGDACHVAGTCDPQTGACSTPAKPDGDPCSDGDACTQTDTCQSGVCTGSSPVVCTAADACHDIGVCDPQTGACSTPAKVDGVSCTDSNSCTQTDTCQAGVCTAGAPVVCPPPDSCHEAGSCNTGSGTCTNVAKADGAPCPGGSCLAGACKPAPLTDAGSSTHSGNVDGGTTNDAGAVSDAGANGGTSDAGAGSNPAAPSFDAAGCGCRTVPAPGGAASFGSALGLALLLARRKRAARRVS